jgi:hypothetical protein
MLRNWWKNLRKLKKATYEHMLRNWGKNLRKLKKGTYEIMLGEKSSKT